MCETGTSLREEQDGGSREGCCCCPLSSSALELKRRIRCSQTFVLFSPMYDKVTFFYPQWHSVTPAGRGAEGGLLGGEGVDGA